MSIQILKSLARLTGKTGEELEGLLNEAGEDQAAETFSSLVLDHFKEAERKSKESFYKKGEKEKAKKVEAALQPIFDEFGITAATVEDSAAQLAEKLKEQPGKPGGEGLNADNLRTLPAYKEAFEADTSALRTKLQQAEQRAAEVEKAQARLEKVSKLKPALVAVLKKENANFGIGEEAAMEAFFKLVPPDRFNVTENGIEVLNEDGEVMKDEYHIPVKPADFLKKTWWPGFNTGNPPPTPSPARQGSNGAQRFESSQAFTNAYTELLRKGDNDGAASLRKSYLAQLSQEE